MNKKEIIKSSVLGVVGVAIGISISVIANGAMELEVYENDYIEKAEALQIAQLNLCNSEKSLALAKLEMYASGNIDYAQDILDRLTIKSKKTCEPIIEEKKDEKTELDIDKLAYAVAQAETGDCTKGSGISKNNCFGIMEWSTGTRQLKAYNTKAESYEDFKRIWEKSYKTFPTTALAKKWTGNDSPETWLFTVNYYYYNK